MSKKNFNFNLDDIKAETIETEKTGTEKKAIKQPKRKEYCLTIQREIMKEIKAIAFKKDIRTNLVIESALIDFIEKTKKENN